MDSEARSGGLWINTNEESIWKIRHIHWRPSCNNVENCFRSGNTHWLGTFHFNEGFVHAQSAGEIRPLIPTTSSEFFWLRINTEQVPDSPDLAVWDVWLFPNLKTTLKTKRLVSWEEKQLPELYCITKNPHQKCCRQWQNCCEKCVMSDGKHFECDSIKFVKRAKLVLYDQRSDTFWTNFVPNSLTKWPGQRGLCLLVSVSIQAMLASIFDFLWILRMRMHTYLLLQRCRSWPSQHISLRLGFDLR